DIAACCDRHLRHDVDTTVSPRAGELVVRGRGAAAICRQNDEQMCHSFGVAHLASLIEPWVRLGFAVQPERRCNARPLFSRSLPPSLSSVSWAVPGASHRSRGRTCWSSPVTMGVWST